MTISYPEVIIDTTVPTHLLYFYRIHGGFSLLLNLLGMVLVAKNNRVVPMYKLFLINIQFFTLIADAEMSILMQPVLLFPLMAGYTNGPLWYWFGISSHFQMGLFLCLLYLQIAAIVSAIVAKHQIIASIGSTAINKLFFWTFVISYHSVSFIIFSSFHFSNLTREEMIYLIDTKFPNAQNVLYLPNVDIYDFAINSWFVAVVTLIVFMLIISIVISIYFSINLFRNLQTKKLIISKRNYTSHRIAIISLMAQSTLPMIVVIIPMSVLNYLFVKTTPNSQSLSNAMMAMYSTHSPLATLVMIITTPHYRKTIFRGMKKQSTTTQFPHYVTNNKQSISGIRLKKISISRVI